MGGVRVGNLIRRQHTYIHNAQGMFDDLHDDD